MKNYNPTPKGDPHKQFMTPEGRAFLRGRLEKTDKRSLTDACEQDGFAYEMTSSVVNRLREVAKLNSLEAFDAHFSGRKAGGTTKTAIRISRDIFALEQGLADPTAEKNVDEAFNEFASGNGTNTQHTEQSSVQTANETEPFSISNAESVIRAQGKNMLRGCFSYHLELVVLGAIISYLRANVPLASKVYTRVIEWLAVEGINRSDRSLQSDKAKFGEAMEKLHALPEHAHLKPPTNMVELRAFRAVVSAHPELFEKECKETLSLASVAETESAEPAASQPTNPILSLVSRLNKATARLGPSIQQNEARSVLVALFADDAPLKNLFQAAGIPPALWEQLIETLHQKGKQA